MVKRKRRCSSSSSSEESSSGESSSESDGSSSEEVQQKRGRGKKAKAEPMKGRKWWDGKVDLFKASYVPKEIYGRSEQYEGLKKHLQNKAGTTVFLYGPPGTGKTAITRGLLNEVTSKKTNVFTLHLTCTSIRSTDALMTYFHNWLESSTSKKKPKAPKPSTPDVWRAMVEEFFGTKKGARRWYLVLDEVDFLLNSAKTKKVQVSSGPVINKQSTCEQILDALIELTVRETGRLHIICISNEKAATYRAIERIPQENRFAFLPYSSSELVEIMKGRLGEAGCGAEEVFADKSMLFVAMKTATNSGGDCRALLENVRRTLANREGEATVTIADVQQSLPYRNELLLWLRSLGSGERLLLVSAVVMASKVQPPYKVKDLSTAFHCIINRFLAGDSCYGTDPASILGVLNQITATHDFIELTTTNPSSGRAKRKPEVDLATQQISLKDTLTPEKLYTSLQSIERSGASATPCALLIEILEYYFPKHAEWC